MVVDPLGTRGNVGHCLEPHDLAANKVAAHRPKDLDFVRTLLAEGMLDVNRLLHRIAALPVASEQRDHLTRWVRATAADM